MMEYQLNITFYLRKGRLNKSGQTTIQVKIALHNEFVRFSTGEKVHLKQWDGEKNFIKEGVQENKLVKKNLLALKMRISKCYHELMFLEDVFDVHDVMAKFRGVPRVKRRTLLQLVKKHNSDFNKRLGVDRSNTTYVKYQLTERRVKSFLKDELGKQDIDLKALKKSFIKGFALYITNVFGYQQNTAAKHVKNLKAILSFGVDLEWLGSNPFTGFKYGYKENPQVILTEEELKRIEEKIFTIPKLERVRLLFLFQCYTGLSYVDMAKLGPDNLCKGIDGKRWLILERSKSSVSVRIPLLSKALAVLNLCKEYSRQVLLPACSLQSMNVYLKEIAELCEINKNLSTHVGRRTFATTVCLSNGVPIETVSKLLGHTNLRTTMLYSKVVDTKLSREMELLDSVLREGTTASKKT